MILLGHCYAILVMERCFLQSGKLMNKRHIRFLILGVLVATVGCGAAPPPSITTYPVTGKVLAADGQPLNGGIIQFILPET